MKFLMMLTLLFALVFASGDGRPLSYSEKVKQLNIDINQCVLKGKISDTVKSLVEGAPEEDIRATLKPIVNELSEGDLEILRNCRSTYLKQYYS